jgi:hypothetical protein
MELAPLFRAARERDLAGDPSEQKSHTRAASVTI